jgi:hypothetical protein
VRRAPADLAAEYVVERVQELAGTRAVQGPRPEKIQVDPSSTLPAVRLIADYRLWSVGELESRGLVGWAMGRRSALLFDEPITPKHIVELQAEGLRCVSLLARIPPREGLDFALHDLRHLEKFFDPDHHRAQIGFFRSWARALGKNDSDRFDGTLDETWREDRDRVLADMNGSPIFLFAVLKMKLKVAVRRRLARERGVEPPFKNALDDEELAAYAPFLDRLLDLLELTGEVRAAAREISARRDRPELGKRLLEHWTSA